MLHLREHIHDMIHETTCLHVLKSLSKASLVQRTLSKIGEKISNPVAEKKYVVP